MSEVIKQDLKTEALKLALEGLEKWHFDKDPRGAADYITAIREALAEQPANVAAVNISSERVDKTEENVHEKPAQPAQPSKPWVGLTDEERDAILDREFKQWWSRHDAVCRAIEAKLREKNT